ncbi:DUF58 domain-containing protein [Murimonas intestini]|uniref:Uncharacterized protein DUF58 n=1 Tax=Murimonas intestini TaxID=1337051 RepID=A0AB73T606_9FIRM|nr:DUF58 domain-containing protein [Murimonas intestini]MCR1842147.1 DUF58 domain-containing protein [Murimonas intestini]MCR1864883.1 DUF58 domain-containing protein [Murimonas intestini]MCR1884211.1 DUF58 domain-containing protein [Murimonas intestini]
MKNKIIYLVLILATAYVYIMFDSDVPLVLLGFEILLPVFLFVTLLSQRSCLKPGIRIRVPVVQKGQKIQVEITADNSGLLPVSRMMFKVVYVSSYGFKSEKEKIVGLADGHDSMVCHYEVDYPYSGRLQFSLQKVKVWDYLKVFSMSVNCSGSETVNVLPNLYEMNLVISPRTRNFPVDGDEYDKTRSGDDVSEIFQVREFRNGDTLQKVHWKLSAKADELMTKEYSLPKGCSVLILLDFQHEKGRNCGEEQMDRFIETAASLMFALTEQECMHYIFWYDGARDSARRFLVQDEEQLYEAIGEMLRVAPYMGNYDMMEAYRAEYNEMNFSTVLRLGTDLKLWRNGDLAAEFSDKPLQQQFASFELEV